MIIKVMYDCHCLLCTTASVCYVRLPLFSGTETCNTLPAKNPTKTGFTADRKTPAPQSSTPLKHGTPSHSPLPVPTRPPPPYTPTLQSPSFHLQDSCSQLNQGSCYASDTPPAHVFTPLEISTSRDFDPLFTYTSPGLAHRFSRPSSTSTTTYTEMLAESLTPHTPSSLHVFTEPPSFESPTAQFCPKSSPAFHTPYESPEILAQSPPSASLHVITESPLLEAPRTQPSPYQPESMFDLLAMSPSSEFFRPQSPPALSTPWTESSPYGDIPTLPSESPSFRSCSSEYFSFETQLSQEQLVPLDKFQTSFTGSSINIPPGNIPATVFETLEKEAQVPGNVLSTDDELLSSQEAELLTLYGWLKEIFIVHRKTKDHIVTMQVFCLIYSVFIQNASCSFWHGQ